VALGHHQLGTGVVVVIDQARAERDQRQRNQEEQVRRVADVHNPDPVPQPDPQRQPQLGHDRDAVLGQVAR